MSCWTIQCPHGWVLAHLFSFFFLLLELVLAWGVCVRRNVTAGGCALSVLERGGAERGVVGREGEGRAWMRGVGRGGEQSRRWNMTRVCGRDGGV